MENKKKPLYGWICLILGILLAVTAAVMMTISIWTGDGRWAYTAFFPGFGSVPLFGIACFGLSD